MATNNNVNNSESLQAPSDTPSSDPPTSPRSNNTYGVNATVGVASGAKSQKYDSFAFWRQKDNQMLSLSGGKSKSKSSGLFHFILLFSFSLSFSFSFIFSSFEHFLFIAFQNVSFSHVVLI
jgi:hypothetical protein